MRAGWTSNCLKFFFQRGNFTSLRFLLRANSRLAEANSKLLNERSRSLISSSIANGSLAGPSLDVGSLGSPAHYGPLNRSLGLGLSFLSPVSEAQNSSVEDYLAKVCAVRRDDFLFPVGCFHPIVL